MYKKVIIAASRDPASFLHPFQIRVGTELVTVPEQTVRSRANTSVQPVLDWFSDCYSAPPATYHLHNPEKKFWRLRDISDWLEEHCQGVAVIEQTYVGSTSPWVVHLTDPIDYQPFSMWYQSQSLNYSFRFEKTSGEERHEIRKWIKDNVRGPSRFDEWSSGCVASVKDDNEAALFKLAFSHILYRTG